LLLTAYSLCVFCLWLCVLCLQTLRKIPKLFHRPVVHFAHFCLYLLPPLCLAYVPMIFAAALLNGQLSEIFVALMLSMLSFAKAIEKLLDIIIFAGDHKALLIATCCAIIAGTLSAITFPFIAAKLVDTYLQGKVENFDLWIVRTLFETQKKLSLSLVLTSILVECLSPAIVNSMNNFERGKIRSLAVAALFLPVYVYFAVCVCSLASFNAEFIIFSSMRHFMYITSLGLLLTVVSDKLGLDI
uniref:Uncharacterized protein n=1 Tax=Romanomermis culicivorax TaxID=13658 RepID=A0A915HH32_ROMCU